MEESKNVEGWVAVFVSGTDYEADIVRDRLDDAGIPAVVFTQRDHAFNLTVGDLSRVRVLVPPHKQAEAEEVLAAVSFTDSELEDAAMSADPISPDAHSPQGEAALDSGIESISLDFEEGEERKRDEASRL